MATSGETFFRVQPQSLERLASELDRQLDATATPADHLAELAAHPIAPGRFGEAAVLAGQHAATVAQLRDLLVAVQQALSFTADVTRLVAAEYERTDAAVAGGYDATGGW